MVAVIRYKRGSSNCRSNGGGSTVDKRSVRCNSTGVLVMEVLLVVTELAL